jgi:hypothetical protein
LVGFALIPAAAIAAPVALDSPNQGDSPLVAFDHLTGTTYVAWTAANDAGIDLCVIAANASGCTGGAPVVLTDAAEGLTSDAAPEIAGLVVQPNGEAVVLGSTAQGGIGTVAWASAPGGAGFLSAGNGLQNGGKPISDVSLFYTTGNAVPLGNSDVGLLDDYGDTFSDSPLAGPESPLITGEDGNSNTAGPFPRKSLTTSGAEIGAEPTPGVPGSETVLAVGDNYADSSYNPPGCFNYAASGYAVKLGTINGTSNAAGTLNSLNSQGLAIPDYGVLECSAESPVVASGGDDGMGVLEQEGPGISGQGKDVTMDWRPFNATSTGGSFGAPVELQDLTSHILVDAEDLQVVDDSTNGVYAEWKDEQGLVLDYSPNGGVTWYPPVLGPTLSPDSESPSDPEIVGLGSGVFDLVYDHDPGSGTQIYSDVLPYSSLVSSPVTVPGSTTATSTSFSITVVCSSACSVTITVTVPGGSGARAGLKNSAKAVTIATGKFSLTAAGKHKITLKFTSKGKTLLTKDHGRIKGNILALDKAPFGTFKDTKVFRITEKTKKKK